MPKVKYKFPETLSFAGHRETTQMMLEASPDANEQDFLRDLLDSKQDLAGNDYRIWRHIKRLRL